MMIWALGRVDDRRRVTGGQSGTERGRVGSEAGESRGGSLTGIGVTGRFPITRTVRRCGSVGRGLD